MSARINASAPLGPPRIKLVTAGRTGPRAVAEADNGRAWLTFDDPAEMREWAQMLIGAADELEAAQRQTGRRAA